MSSNLYRPLLLQLWSVSFRFSIDHILDLSLSFQKNQDHCSACRFVGALLYCDSCPRAFHMWCLDPPMEDDDVPSGAWFCPGCELQKVGGELAPAFTAVDLFLIQNPPPKPSRSFMAPLIVQAQNFIPREYELPDEIRTFFKDGIDYIWSFVAMLISFSDFWPPRPIR